MSTSETGNRQDSAAAPITRAVAEARIDAAHHAAAPQVPDPGAGSASGKEPDAAAEQLRTQANQLAEHLRGRQKDLDHREAELNARNAQLESDLRGARLWLSERIAELQQRAAEPSVEQTARQQSLEQAAGELEAKRKQLEQAEARLQEERAEMQKLQEQLSARQRDVDEQDRLRREHLEAERRQALADVEEQRRAVGRRAEHVDRSRATLEQLRGELDRLHRETLEIRLATEELWVQLSGAAPPAALVQSLGRIRGKLAEHYRLANAELHAQKEELERTRGQLAEQHDKLAQERRRFEQWAATQQKETQQQASRLIARERQLDRRETELRTHSQQWQVERCELQQELRSLRAESANRAETAERTEEMSFRGP